MAVHKPGGEISEETDPVNIFLLDFSSPELWENKFLLFKSPSWWSSAMAAPANYHMLQNYTWNKWLQMPWHTCTLPVVRKPPVPPFFFFGWKYIFWNFCLYIYIYFFKWRQCFSFTCSCFLVRIRIFSHVIGWWLLWISSSVNYVCHWPLLKIILLLLFLTWRNYLYIWPNNTFLYTLQRSSPNLWFVFWLGLGDSLHLSFSSWASIVRDHARCYRT